ncbi:MAG: hypothetical protein JXR70_03555 [Spirochaetales bacterium]|nr:hypothetical protein [Spirochaetales bacterium]
MKRTLFLIFVSSLILLTGTSQVFAADALCGDVDANGRVNIVDALLAAQIYVGFDIEYEKCWTDVDGDDKITILDALFIAQYYIGLIKEFKGCQDCGSQPTPSIPAKEAESIYLNRVIPQLEPVIDKTKGLVVHRYADFLTIGSILEIAELRDSAIRTLECKNPSWIFFADLDPIAHFGHPVQITLMDGVTGEIMTFKSDWWPKVNGHDIFSTLRERTNTATQIYKVDSILKLLEPVGNLLDFKPLPFSNPCNAWAVLVCGYNDLPDSFDEDTNDMYALLKSLGITDDHIFYLSPHATHAGVDRPTSISNVQWAINQVAASADRSSKVLFFYSSHGGIDSLSCAPDIAGGGSVSANDLDNWLDGITCNEMSIIIEACHSGSLIGRYEDGTYKTNEDNLTGEGEKNRCIFTSASTDTSSYPDVDNGVDPNITDTGSETIHGYIEAFYMASADTNSNGEVSFGEAYTYAWNMDSTRLAGLNTPQMTSTGLNPNNVYNYCHQGYSDTATITSLSPASPATILVNQQVTINFSYSISDPSGARIFIRPMTGNGTTPGYAASGSPLYTGNGSSSATFSITSGNNVSIDRLRIQVYDADQSTLYFEDYRNVNYTVVAARVTITSLSPASPATIHLNQDVNINFSYGIGPSSGARIFIRPMTGGSLTPGYAASGSALFTGIGTGTSFFRITAGNNLHIDQLRIQVLDPDTNAVLLQSFVNVDYTVRNTNTANITLLSPSSPATISLNQDVNISFNYTIDNTDGARIFIRPMTGGSLTPAYAASGSALFSGSGTATAFFRITSGNNVHIDQLRIQILDATTNEVLHQSFVNVDYTVRNTNTARITNLSPASPATMALDQDVNINFSYTIDNTDGARIFIRPMTGSSLTPAYAASGSALFSGSGTATAFFRITSGNNVHIDQLRIQIVDAVSNEILSQSYLSVDYLVNPVIIN